MSFSYYVVDALTNPGKAFSGNPAAVVILKDDADITDSRKQLIALEFNLSETVYVSKWSDASDGEGASFLIRWFTPTDEIPLCGHATMAVSHVLFNVPNLYSDLISDSIKYRTKYGAHLEVTFDGTHLSMNFPRNDPLPLEDTPWLDQIKAATLATCGQSTDLIIDAQLSLSTKYLLLRLAEGADLSKVTPDCNRLLAVDSGDKVKALLVTQKIDPKKDGTHFLVRVFAPWWGVVEDPVCGSAFTVLTPYWDKVYQTEEKQKIDTFVTLQTSTRSGLIRSQLIDKERMLISGQAKVFSSGTFSL